MNIPITPIAGHEHLDHMPYFERYAAYVRGDLRPEKTMMPKYTEEMLPKEKLEAIGAYLSQDPAAARRLVGGEPAAP
jgi:hypothetical protein